MKTKLFTAMLMVLSITACKKEIKLEVKQIKETDKTTEWNITTCIFCNRNRNRNRKKLC